MHQNQNSWLKFATLIEMTSKYPISKHAARKKPNDTNVKEKNIQNNLAAAPLAGVVAQHSSRYK
jgi:hypothetical protein